MAAEVCPLSWCFACMRLREDGGKAMSRVRWLGGSRSFVTSFRQGTLALKTTGPWSSRGVDISGWWKQGRRVDG